MYQRCNCIYCSDIPDYQMQQHHLFSNTKRNRFYYGELIHDLRNIMLISEAHHLWKPIPKFTELEFCEALNIKPRSKIAKEIYERGCKNEIDEHLEV